jgi:hypothetical protein
MVPAVVGVAAVVTLCFSPGAAAEPATDFPTDGHGYVNTAAHCDDGQTVMMFGRTARALVAVCVGPDGQLQYRGVRLSDRAGLVMGAGRGDDGAVIAGNDGVTYSVSPAAFLVSEGDTVLYEDAWEDFHQPSGATATGTPSSPAPSTTAAPSSTPATSSPTATSPTVSTTTVTPTVRKPSGS